MFLRQTALIVALLPLFLIVLSATTHAKNDPAAVGAIAGVILDPDAKAVVGAGIVIRNEETGEIHDHDAQLDSGQFGGDGRSRLLVEGHEMLSDGFAPRKP